MRKACENNSRAGECEKTENLEQILKTNKTAELDLSTNELINSV